MAERDNERAQGDGVGRKRQAMHVLRCGRHRGHAATQHHAQAEGEQHRHQVGLAERTTQHEPFQSCAEQGHRKHCADHGEGQRPARAQMQRESGKAAHHQQITLHEADSGSGFVDEHEGQRHQPIHATDGNAAGEDLKEGKHRTEVALS